jgi:hypothetical protein
VANRTKAHLEGGEILIGHSEAMKKVQRTIAAVAPSDLPVLITGEVGTGKELVARLVHLNSGRKDRPFVPINLTSMPSSLVSAELVGSAKGAFTGADRNRRGVLESAHGGTLFLDELEDAPLEAQMLLLRAIDSGTIRPVGGEREVAVDFRVVAAVRSELSELARGRTIRQDFLHRVASAVIRVPPLRERTEDIPELANHFLSNFRRDQGRELQISSAALAALAAYDFPGNVRELAGIILRAAISSESGIIEPEHLSLEPRRSLPTSADIESLRQALANAQQQVETLRQSTIPARPIWEGTSFPIEGDYCFVLMPFSDIADVQRVYTDHVKAVLEQRCGLRCERADDIYDISGVMQSVWEGINRARVVIADLTGRNPNVFYELGIAHTLGKPVIMLTQSMDSVPFDLRHLRCIVYDYKPKTIERLEKALERTVRTVLSATDSAVLSLIQQRSE